MKCRLPPRVDVEEAPYAPGNDLLYVTELEDAHDSFKLLKSVDNLEFFYTETLSIFNSDETSGQCKKTCLDDTCSAQMIAVIITCHVEEDLSSVRKSKSRTQRYSASGWCWMNLRLCKAFEREKISIVFSSLPDMRNASSVGSLSHATLPICVRSKKQRDTQGTKRAKCAHVGDTNNAPPDANRESGVIQTSNALVSYSCLHFAFLHAHHARTWSQMLFVSPT